MRSVSTVRQAGFERWIDLAIDAISSMKPCTNDPS
jgi:hypothetical protein